MTDPQKKTWTKEEEEELLKELCLSNGVNYAHLVQEGQNTRVLEMFFSGYPKLVGLHHFPNLYCLCIMGQTLQRIENLSRLTKLRELWLAECGLLKIEGLDACKSLWKLYLYSNEIKKIENLDQLTQLEVLWINNNNLSIIQGLTNLTKLKELNLADNQIEKIGHSLDCLSRLENLNMSGNRLSSFKDITYLVRLPNLTSLGLKDPTHSPNPVCTLCNYTTHVLYHLPNLTRLDSYDVSHKTLREIAETTVMKKKMYYGMRVKTVRRNQADLVTRLNEARDEIYYKQPHERIRALVYAIKEIEREIEELEYSSSESSRGSESGTESDKDAKENEVEEKRSMVEKLQNKRDVLRDRIEKWEKKSGEIDFFYTESLLKIKQASDMACSRLLTELETGGNVRFEDGRPTDVWFTSCQDLILSRFCAVDYREYGIQGIKINRITRVHNRILRTKFEEKLNAMLDEEDSYLPSSKSNSYKKLIEYLFWVWDPEMAGGVNEPGRVLEEGYLDANTYKQLGKDAAVTLTNSLSIADKLRMDYMKKQTRGKPYKDLCPFRHGQLIISKVYMGKTAQALDCKIDKGYYLKADSVFRPRKVDHANTSTSSNNNGTCSSIGNNGATSCECASRQCEWFIFDNELVVPEYVVDFEYITRLKPVHPFAFLDDGEFDVKENVSPSNDPQADDDVLQMDPVLKQRPRMVTLTEDLIKKAGHSSSLKNVTEINLHGNGLTKLKPLQTLNALKKLIVSFNELTRLDDVAKMGLEYLDASFNKITTLEGMKSMERLKFLDLSWNNLYSTREELAIMRKHIPQLQTLDIRHNPWQKPDGLRLRAIGRLKALRELDNEIVTESEAAAALRMAAGSRISQVSMLAHSRTDETRPRTLSLGCFAQVLSQTSWHKPDRVGDQDNQWYSKVTALNLDGQHISKLSNLDRLENLKWASFSDNDLTKIEGLDSCINLEELSLENNCITKIENISKLTKLKRLMIGHNYISTLDNVGLDKLASLLHLSVENNSLTSLMGVQRISTLMELYVGNNNITNIREIFYLKPLQHLLILDLCGNKVSMTTDNYRFYIIYHLKPLKALDGIAIEASEATQSKDLYGGRLTPDFVAEKLGHGNFREVREIDFPSSALRTVDLGAPEQFLNLRSVNLEHNNMSSFSGLIYLVNLRVLCLNHNHIECIVPKPKANSVPKSRITTNTGISGLLNGGTSEFTNPESYTPILESLEVLHLGYNGIKSIVDLQVSRLPNLKALFLQGNEITKVEGLEGLQDLRELVLDRNKIKSVTELSFMNQWNLQELHMEENRIKELVNLSGLEHLQRLYLGMNRIQDIAELEKLEVLPNLIELSVVSNAVARRLLHRPMLVYRMPNLMVIDGIPVSEEERTKAELYFLDQQPPQITTTVETTLPGIGQYKTTIPVKVTNVQLSSPERMPWSGTIHYAEEPSMSDMQRGGGRRRANAAGGQPTANTNNNKAGGQYSSQAASMQGRGGGSYGYQQSPGGYTQYQGQGQGQGEYMSHTESLARLMGKNNRKQ